MFTKASLIALFAAVVAAQTPGFNPITRPLNEIVPACAPFTITWTVTSTNAVNLVLLKGPSINVVPIGNIAEGIANSGSFAWTPEATLDATTDATGYGLKIVDAVTGDFQYSTQFGISKEQCKDAPSSTPSASASGYPTYTPPSYTPSETPSSDYPTSTPEVTSTPVYTPTGYPTGYPHSTGAPVYNSTIILPSKSMTIPSTLLPSATSGSPSGTSTPPAQATGAASALQAGLGLAGAIAGLVFVL